MRDWSFMWRRLWLLSHVFAVCMVLLFVGLGLWQLDRLGQRQAANDLIEQRTQSEPQTINEMAQLDSDIEFRPVRDQGIFVDSDIVRIGSQTQDGAAGDHVVGLVELSDGSRLFVNRGFVPLASADEVPDVSGEAVEVVGWVRLSQSKEGVFGADDGQSTDRLPRFNVPTIAQLTDGEVVPFWVQLNSDADPASPPSERALPNSLALPPLDEGNHFSYALQWFAFALLGSLYYVTVLLRKAKKLSESAPKQPEASE